jgi:UDP-glucose 4-epimerase
LRAGGDNLVANCGYGRGYSVLEVIDSVNRIIGRPLEIHRAERRAGDAAAVVANADLARRELNWTPKYADLDVIVADALAWEEILSRSNRRELGDINF